jgi:hypothetical protein
MSREVKFWLKSIGLEVYPVIVFYVAYLGVVELGILVPFRSLSTLQTGAVMLATSPFSFIEVVGKTPAQTEQGLWNNLFVPAALMVFAMIYNFSLSKRLKRYVSVPSIFGAGVIASYLISGTVWMLSPLPSTGTSIIGFDFAIAMALAAFSDLFESRRKEGEPRPDMKTVLRIIGISMFAALGLGIAFLGYLWSNPSWYLHLAGGGLSLVLVLLWRRMGTPPIWNLLTKSSKSPRLDSPC